MVIGSFPCFALDLFLLSLSLSYQIHWSVTLHLTILLELLFISRTAFSVTVTHTQYLTISKSSSRFQKHILRRCLEEFR